MKDVDVTAVFCEMLSGLAAIALLVGLLDLTQQLEVGRLIHWIAANPTFSTVASLLIAAYLIGLIVDAIGMAFDSFVVERIPALRSLLKYAGKLPKGFYTTATEFQLKFFCEQWAYFCCYRNLLILVIAGLAPAILIAHKYGGGMWVLATIAGLALVTVALVESIRCLQGILLRIAEPAP